jgi:hypothetical protein
VVRNGGKCGLRLIPCQMSAMGSYIGFMFNMLQATLLVCQQQ